MTVALYSINKFSSCLEKTDGLVLHKDIHRDKSNFANPGLAVCK